MKDQWPALATEGTDTYGLDWTRRLPTGVNVSSVAYEADPDSGLTFSGAAVISNVSSVTITADESEQEYQVKLSPTLSSGSISPVSVRVKVVKHKPAS